MRPAFSLIDYVPGPGPQRNFIRDSAWQSLRQSWPYSDVPRRELLARMTREMAVPGTVTKIITPVGSPDDFVGWISARPTAFTVVMVFIKSPFRKWGIATMALRELCPDLDYTGKIGVVFMTPMAIQISADHGHRLVPAHGFDYKEGK